MSYYDLKRYETEINLAIAGSIIYIILVFFTYKYIAGITAVTVAILYLYLLLLFFPKIFKSLSGFLFSGIVITSLIIAIMFWYFKVSIPPMGVITDDQMLILVTLLYVFLTYKIMKSNSSMYQYERIPQLFVDVNKKYNNHLMFNVKNMSPFHAVDLEVTFEIVYPIPTSFSPIIKLFIERSYIHKTKSIFCKNKQDSYLIKYTSEYLEPDCPISLDIQNEIHSLIDKNEEFHIIVKYDYKSLDNLSIEKPLYKLFKFKMEQNGINLVHKSGNPIKSN